MTNELRLGLAELDGFLASEPSKPPGAERATPFLQIDEMQEALARLIVLTRGVVAVLEEVIADK